MGFTTCPHCGKTDNAAYVKCPSCGEPMASEDKEQQPHTIVETIIRLMPLWIFIVFNVAYWVYYTIYTNGLPPLSGPMDTNYFGAGMLFYGGMIGNVIYLIMWAIIANQSRRK
jgi:hypothetical protein